MFPGNQSVYFRYCMLFFIRFILKTWKNEENPREYIFHQMKWSENYLDFQVKSNYTHSKLYMKLVFVPFDCVLVLFAWAVEIFVFWNKLFPVRIIFPFFIFRNIDRILWYFLFEYQTLFVNWVSIPCYVYSIFDSTLFLFISKGNKGKMKSRFPFSIWIANHLILSNLFIYFYSYSFSSEWKYDSKKGKKMDVPLMNINKFINIMEWHHMK